MKETWKAIVRYEGIYEVSDRGRVRSLKYGKAKILTPWKTCDGYLAVKLYKDGKLKTVTVHRLVAEAFIPNPNNLETVNHKDEVKTNNDASNLEWMTRADNKRYSANKPVQMFDKSTGELLAIYPSTIEAERVTGIAHESIVNCCNGKYKSAGGFVWRHLPGNVLI